MLKEMKRKPGRPRDTDSATTRQTLIDTARDCFGRNGYDRTSNSEIVELAGLTTGPLYHHFASKAGLFGAVSNDAIERVLSRLEKALDGSSSIKPPERLLLVLGVMEDMYTKDESVALFNATWPLEIQRNPELLAHINKNKLKKIQELFPFVPKGTSNTVEELDNRIADLTTVLYFGITYCVLLENLSKPKEIMDTILSALDGTLFRS
jgi:AcrR family transcriptional regulator